jgi:acyl carrier protein
MNKNTTISEIIQSAIQAQMPLLPEPMDLSQGEAIRLFGEGGALDSMGLVTLVLTIEEMIEDEMGVAITIVSEKAMSARRSPFATIGSLAEFIDSLIQEKQHA